MVAAGVQEQSVRIFHCEQRDGDLHTLPERKFHTGGNEYLLVDIARAGGRLFSGTKPGSLDKSRSIQEDRVGFTDHIGDTVDAVMQTALGNPKFFRAVFFIARSFLWLTI